MDAYFDRADFVKAAGLPRARSIWSQLSLRTDGLFFAIWLRHGY